ncbi:MAG TPA: hypothetical protein VKH37_12960 [Ferruginibacter sp.]|nr:hypothetical protein [Ferruginibacter sp.]
MKKIVITLLGLAGFFMANAQLSAQDKKERIQASYMIVTGRPPSQGELDYWAKREDLTIPQLVDFHKQYIPKDVTFHRTLIIKSYIDALGRRPSEDEIKYWSAGVDTYTDLMKKHIQWLTGNPAEYEKTIKRSYMQVLKRQPNADELAWWKQQGVYSYVALCGCHADWARRNNQGVKNTITSMASSIMQMVPLGGKVAGEVKTVMGIPILGEILAVGAEKIKSAIGTTMISSTENLISNLPSQ